PAELDALLQAVGKLANRNLADVLDLEEVDDALDNLAMLDLLAFSGAGAQRLPKQPGPHAQVAAGHDVVERAHAAKQRDVLESAGDALFGRLVRAHARALHALICDGALLRMIEAVDTVQH